MGGWGFQVLGFKLIEQSYPPQENFGASHLRVSQEFLYPSRNHVFSSLFYHSHVPLCSQTLVFIDLLCLSDHQVKVPSYKDLSAQQQGPPYLVDADGEKQILISEHPISLRLNDIYLYIYVCVCISMYQACVH